MIRRIGAPLILALCLISLSACVIAPPPPGRPWVPGRFNGWRWVPGHWV